MQGQTVLITGATSGIGLSTARLAAEGGAAVVLVARNEEALRALAEEIRANGGRAAYAVADVADEAQVERAATVAEEAFGGFDTWINNAGISIYGCLEDTPTEDHRRVFETNYWGVVYGSLAAVQRLRGRPQGGALINVGSVLSDQAIPIQGVYSASKHAVKGFTNALRMELMRSAQDISVTLIKPSAIDTPYKEHARNYMASPAANPPPIYSARLVAQAVLYAAEHPVRELTIGGGGRMLSLFGTFAPLLAEPLYARLIPWMHRDRPENHVRDSDALHHAGKDLREHSAYPLVRQTSLYTAAQMRPQVTLAAFLALGAAAALTLGVRGKLKGMRVRREIRAEEVQRLERRKAPAR